MRFIRTDLMDPDCTEEITLVSSSMHYYSTWLEAESPYIVQVCQGEHFAGLFSLDGDAITSPPASWEVAADADIPAEVVAAIEEGWTTGNYTVERHP